MAPKIFGNNSFHFCCCVGPMPSLETLNGPLHALQALKLYQAILRPCESLIRPSECFITRPMHLIKSPSTPLSTSSSHNVPFFPSKSSFKSRSPPPSHYQGPLTPLEVPRTPFQVLTPVSSPICRLDPFLALLRPLCHIQGLNPFLSLRNASSAPLTHLLSLPQRPRPSLLPSPRLSLVSSRHPYPYSSPYSLLKVSSQNSPRDPLTSRFSLSTPLTVPLTYSPHPLLTSSPCPYSPPLCASHTF